jgi:endonuclease/exonuclease/phosphatase family metal-dependent hydrolase
MRQLGIIISSHDPDVICLQEVTPVIMSLLLSQEWTRSYFVTDPEGKQLNSYGTYSFRYFYLFLLH